MLVSLVIISLTTELTKVLPIPSATKLRFILMINDWWMGLRSSLERLSRREMQPS